MSRLVINGGRRLKGEVEIEGSKNAVLPILAATVLNSGINVIRNCPKFKDVDTMLDILRGIGCKVTTESDAIIIDSSAAYCTIIPEKLAAEMRSSIIFMGPMISRFKKVTISYPGECATLQAHFKVRGHAAAGAGHSLCGMSPKNMAE